MMQKESSGVCEALNRRWRQARPRLGDPPAATSDPFTRPAKAREWFAPTKRSWRFSSLFNCRLAKLDDNSP
jgi:hypothetical protein